MHSSFLSVKPDTDSDSPIPIPGTSDEKYPSIDSHLLARELAALFVGQFVVDRIIHSFFPAMMDEIVEVVLEDSRQG